MLNIKNKLNNFVVKIGEEPNNFAKCVVIYDYMDFVHKNDKLRKVLQNIIDDIPTQISLFMEREITLCEADLFDSKIELVNNDWTHYVILSNMYYLLREYVKESKARRAFLDKELDKGFSLPYSREQFELSLKAFNQKLFHAIDKEFFVNFSLPIYVYQYMFYNKLIANYFLWLGGRDVIGTWFNGSFS